MDYKYCSIFVGFSFTMAVLRFWSWFLFFRCDSFNCE